MSYVVKLGAYGLAGVAAFAVAVAMMLSVSSTPTAEAATVQLPTDGTSATAAPGDTVQITVTAPFAQVTITDTAEGVGASFAANDGQAISCSDDGSCDTDDSNTTTAGRQNVADEVRVALNIDADSGEGHILITIAPVGGTGSDITTRTKVITVSKGGQVGSLTIKADTAADKTINATAGTSDITVEVKNASTPAGPLAAQSVAVTTTHGTVACGVGAGSATAAPGDTQTCSANSGADGVVDVVLTGGGVEGQAVVTARLGTRTATVTVTMFGTARNLMAEPMQNSVEIGGSVFVVLTVTDGAGNPVAGLQINPVTSKEVVGPEGVDNPVLVTTEKATAAGTAGTTTVPIGVRYSKDYVAAKAADNIPACGDDNAHIGADNATYDELFGEDDAAGTSTVGEGTNAAGQCVVYVTAPDGGTARTTATRGAHTLNFQVSATVKASATIEVAGKPASISTDAPAMVDPASVTTITVSVWDDEDVLVGITDVTVRKVGGDGLIEDQGDGNTEKTANGQSKFTFIAPSTAGSSEILISAGDVDHRVTIQIGEVEPPTPPVSVSGESGLVIVKNANSIEDILGALMCGSTTGTTVTLPGDNIYSVGAPALANRQFMANVSFPVAEAAAYVACGG